MRATLTFTNGKVDAFKFQVDGLKVTLGSYLTLTATSFVLDTGADTNVDPKSRLVQFGSLGAQINVGGLQIGGEADNFGFAYNKQTDTSSFKAGDPNDATKQFAVILKIGSADGGSFGWPSWLPIHITTLGLRFKNFEAEPQRLHPHPLRLGRRPAGGGGPEVLGGDRRHRDRPVAAVPGQVPGHLARGDRGQHLGQPLRRHARRRAPRRHPPDQPHGHRPQERLLRRPRRHQGTDKVLYMAVQGGFSLPGIGGLTIRFALSQLGPLGVFINVEIPGGILLEPFTGLSINNFSAGVEFFKTLPSIDDPEKLRGPEFNVSPTVSADTWLASIKTQVFTQFVTLEGQPQPQRVHGRLHPAAGDPGLGRPLLDLHVARKRSTPRCRSSSAPTASSSIKGKLNFAANQLSVSGTLYADLSKVADGRVVVLFLADLPDQIRLLTIEGKFSMGFRSADGSDVTLDTGNSSAAVTSSATTGVLVLPAAGQAADAGSLNANLFSDAAHTNAAFVDVELLTGRTSSSTTRRSSARPPRRSRASSPSPTARRSTSSSAPSPLPIEAILGNSGSVDATASRSPAARRRTPSLSGSASDPTFLAMLQNNGVHKFRYLIANAAFQWTPGRGQDQLPRGLVERAGRHALHGRRPGVRRHGTERLAGQPPGRRAVQPPHVLPVQPEPGRQPHRRHVHPARAATPAPPSRPR